MPEDRITIQEAMRILHRSEKQVRRHIKTGRLFGKIGQDGKYYLLRSEVEAMARHPERMQEDKLARHITNLEKRIDEIEKRLDSLSTHVDEMIEALYAMSEPPTAQSPPTTRREQAKPSVGHSGAIVGLPDDLVAFVDFYKAHHISESTARRVLDEHKDAALYGEWKPGGNKVIKQALDAQGRHVFYEAFKTKTSFKPCPDCPH